MSVTKSIKEQTKQNGARPSTKNYTNSDYPAWITLSLTPEEKQFLLEQRGDWIPLEQALSELLEKGCTLRVWSNVDPDYIEVSLREKRQQWKDEKQVSFRAKTLDNAVMGLHYALSRHAPGWPYKAPESIEF